MHQNESYKDSRPGCLTAPKRANAVPAEFAYVLNNVAATGRG